MMNARSQLTYSFVFVIALIGGVLSGPVIGSAFSATKEKAALIDWLEGSRGRASKHDVEALLKMWQEGLSCLPGDVTLPCDREVRLNLANNLLQAARLFELNVKVDNFFDYAEKELASASRSQRELAIWTVGLVESGRAIGLLQAIAIDSNDVEAKLAISSIAFMCSKEAEMALNEIDRKIHNNSSLSEFLRNSVEKARAFNERNGICTARKVGLR